MNERTENRGLRPCPFCGGEAAFGFVRYGAATVKEQGWEQDTFHYVHCIRCGGSAKGIVGHRTREEAREQWNRRAGEDALLEALKAEREFSRRECLNGEPLCGADGEFCDACTGEMERLESMKRAAIVRTARQRFDDWWEEG